VFFRRLLPHYILESNSKYRQWTLWILLHYLLHSVSYCFWIANTELGVEVTFNGIMFTQRSLKIGHVFQGLK
jgi:hypothetical protein